MLALLALVVCLFVGIAHERSRRTRSEGPLQNCALVCMVTITIFGGVMVDVGSFRTNAGAVVYAAVLTLHYLIMRRFGWMAGMRCMIGTFLSLVMLTAIMTIMAEMVNPGQLGDAYTTVIETSRRVAVASFVAFALGQTLFVLFYRVAEHLPLAISYGANIVVVQALDSAVFFPIAFGFDDLFSGPMLPGYFLKVALGLSAVPLLVLATRPEVPQPNN